MEKSAFVARQKSTQGLERLRACLHDAIQGLQFEDPSKPCLDILSKLTGLLWARIVECRALLGNDGEGGDGEAGGVSKFGSEVQAKRVQEEFAPIARFFVEKASPFLDGVGKDHGWFIAVLKTGLREPAERLTFCSRIAPFCDTWATDLRRRASEKSVVRNSFFCQIWLTTYMAASMDTWSWRRRRRISRRRSSSSREMLKESLWTLRQCRTTRSRRSPTSSSRW